MSTIVGSPWGCTLLGGFPPVFLDNGSVEVRIKLENIECIEADDKHCIVHMTDGSRHRLSDGIGVMAGIMPTEIFVKVNRSCIVNIYQIRQIVGRSLYLYSGRSVVVGKTFGNPLKGKVIILGKHR